MHPLKQWQLEAFARRAVEALREKGFNAQYAQDTAQARHMVLDLIPKGSTIGLGGSETVAALNVYDTLRTDEYKLYDRYNCSDHFAVCRESLLADVFLTGTNAVTLNGELVNIDCSGSRVAAIAYGPKTVIVVVGANKVVPTVTEAIARCREIAPMNCKRNHHHTPCAELSICADCNTRERMCNHLSITLNGKKFENRFHVIVIADALGF